MNETETRVLIDDLLRQAGWQLPGQPSPNVRMEYPAKTDDADRAADYVLLDQNGRPMAVIEAKNATVIPLHAKEQARAYAESLNVRFVILSNGSLHYFWDLRKGDPVPVQNMPTASSLESRGKLPLAPQSFAAQNIGQDYIAQTQGATTPPEKIRHLRPYQQDAVCAVQTAAAQGRARFLLEMATGTGKTLVAAAIIKMYLRSSQAKRVLFLVDRVELETQAAGNMRDYLGNDYDTVIYKERKTDWQKAHIVIATVQSLAYEDRYRAAFSPLDFDLLIVDEAHRAICGAGARGVFDYFIGHKVGLTATPKDYLRGVSEEELQAHNPKALEQRKLRDTYTIFGDAVFCYNLQKGVADNVLLSPTLLDARTEITTELLSAEGLDLVVTDAESGDTEEVKFTRRDYERKLFSPATARAQCRTFLDNARRDPISDEIGKTIIYCVSQNHAARTTQILNELASERWADKYQSDFAMQITSWVEEASKKSRDFVYNTLGGSGNFLPGYRTSKTRVCVTVGMMTTGYDCPDLLNLCLFRPIFSPSEFVQIKGRGTRRHSFKYRGEDGEEQNIAKEGFSLFDFFAVCEYFEHEHEYDKKLSLSVGPDDDADEADPSEPPVVAPKGTYIYEGGDQTRSIKTEEIREEGMRVDRELTREKLLDEEVGKYVAAQNPEETHLMGATVALKAYLASGKVREIIDQKEYGRLSNMPELTDEEWSKLPRKLRDGMMQYVKDYVDVNKFDEDKFAA